MDCVFPFLPSNSCPVMTAYVSVFFFLLSKSEEIRSTHWSKPWRRINENEAWRKWSRRKSGNSAWFPRWPWIVADAAPSRERLPNRSSRVRPAVRSCFWTDNCSNSNDPAGEVPCRDLSIRYWSLPVFIVSQRQSYGGALKQLTYFTYKSTMGVFIFCPLGLTQKSTWAWKSRETGSCEAAKHRLMALPSITCPWPWVT